MHLQVSTYQRQHGNVLIITLVLMTMLLISGTSSISTVMVQQRIATTYQNQNIAFTVAEESLNQGEAYVNDNLKNVFESKKPANHHNIDWNLNAATNFTPIDVSKVEWSEHTVSSQINSQKNAEGAYVIQLQDRLVIPGEELGQAAYIHGSEVNFFKIGAYGNAPNGARRVIDVVYASLN